MNRQTYRGTLVQVDKSDILVGQRGRTRAINRQVDSLTGTQRDGCTDRQTDIQTNRQGKQTGRDGRTGEQRDRQG